MDQDASAQILERVRQAFAVRAPLSIVGGGSKSFFGREISGADLDVGAHRGITAYDPAELVLTARAGTPLDEIERALAGNGQCLGFEPPHFGASATLGGTIACALAGPARAYLGSAKDFVLGVAVITGEAKRLRFGGQVIKNVAGYDVARAMVGALGTLGVLTEVSIRVLPRAPHSVSLAFELDAAAALARLNEWARRASCLSASCWHDGRLRIRLSGSEAAIQAARARFGGEPWADPEEFWRSLREQTHEFFAASAPLLRLVLPAATPPLELPAATLIEWGGAQRWIAGAADFERVHAAASAAGGFVSRFRGADRRGEVFAKPSAAAMRLQRSLKSIFDPAAILNRGRLYADL